MATVEKIRNKEKHFYLQKWEEGDDRSVEITADIASKLEWLSKRVVYNKYKVIKNKIEQICAEYKNKSDQKIAKMLCFEAICLGISSHNYNNKSLSCLKQFCKEEPDLLIEIAKHHPEYFIEEKIIRRCIEYFPEKFESLKVLL